MNHHQWQLVRKIDVGVSTGYSDDDWLTTQNTNVEDALNEIRGTELMPFSTVGSGYTFAHLLVMLTCVSKANNVISQAGTVATITLDQVINKPGRILRIQTLTDMASGTGTMANVANTLQRIPMGDYGIGLYTVAGMPATDKYLLVHARIV